MNNESIESTEIQVVQPSALEHLTRGEVDIQIATARQYPRSVKQALSRMEELATINRVTARSTFYRLPRKEWDEQTRRYVEKFIEGPSVRLAEIAASAFGNLRFGARVVEIGHARVTAQGFAHDLETNNACSVEVSASILGKKGGRYPEHMVTTTANAAAAKALRNAIFKIIPRAYIDQVLARCRKVAIGEGMTMLQRWREVSERFASHGVDEPKVLKCIGRKGVPDVTTDDLLQLHGLLTAVEDGDITIEKAMRPSVEDGAERSTVADDATPEEQAELDAAAAAQADKDEEAKLIAELSETDAEGVEKITRNAPDTKSSVAELRRMAARMKAGETDGEGE